MSYLIVLSFDEEKGAEEVREVMGKLQRQHIIPLPGSGREAAGGIRSR